MIELWNLILFHPLINALVFLHQLTGNLGWAIITLTIALRFLMTPLVLPGLRLSKKMAELAPEVAKLKAKHERDKTALAFPPQLHPLFFQSFTIRLSTLHSVFLP